MPNISNRGANTYASPIRKLSGFANQAKAAGKYVYHLNIGQPDIATPTIALEKIKNLDLTVVEYAPAEGIRSYREALVDYYKAFDINVTADQILITTGASEAILFSMLSCMDAGDEIIIPEPFYAIYNGFSQMSNLTILPITSYLETGFKLPEVTEFEQVITEKTKAIFICNPNNPTGCLYSKENLIALAKLANKHDLFLFVDEVYREFCYDDGEFFSALNIEGMEENVVVMDSISKRFSACGARVGALVTRNQEVLDTVVRFSRLRLSSPTLGQILAEATLSEPPAYIEMARSEYDLRRKTVYERLSKIEGVDCYLPGGAFYCFVRLPVADSEHFCQWLLEEFTYQNKTVMLAPGGGFYASKGLGYNEVRIAYVLNVKDLHGAMDCLEEALRIYLKN
ncbi:MAG: aspartate aminotransferase [Paraglaciecola sp.]|jgi:aspartate aminotransferase